jgi:hypothetical protein
MNIMKKYKLILSTFVSCIIISACSDACKNVDIVWNDNQGTILVNDAFIKHNQYRYNQKLNSTTIRNGFYKLEFVPKNNYRFICWEKCEIQGDTENIIETIVDNPIYYVVDDNDLVKTKKHKCIIKAVSYQ